MLLVPSSVNVPLLPRCPPRMHRRLAAASWFLRCCSGLGASTSSCCCCSMPAWISALSLFLPGSHVSSGFCLPFASASWTAAASCCLPDSWIPGCFWTLLSSLPSALILNRRRQVNLPTLVANARVLVQGRVMVLVLASNGICCCLTPDLKLLAALFPLDCLLLLVVNLEPLCPPLSPVSAAAGPAVRPIYTSSLSTQLAFPRPGSIINPFPPCASRKPRPKMTPAHQSLQQFATTPRRTHKANTRRAPPKVLVTTKEIPRTRTFTLQTHHEVAPLAPAKKTPPTRAPALFKVEFSSLHDHLHDTHESINLGRKLCHAYQLSIS